MNQSSPSTLDTLPEFFSPALAAAVLHISKATAYRKAASGEIPSMRLGKRLIISKTHFVSWIDSSMCSCGK